MSEYFKDDPLPSKFHIVYFCSERKKIGVVEIVPALDYELNDYSVASREHFYSRKEAIAYARELAKKHGIEFEPSCKEDEAEYILLD